MLFTEEFSRRLGQMSVQVERIVKQCIVGDKVLLGQILGQMFVQVWERSRSKTNVPHLASTTIDLLCLLFEQQLSAKDLNMTLGFDSTKELKRKIIRPLLD